MALLRHDMGSTGMASWGGAARCARAHRNALASRIVERVQHAYALENAIFNSAPAPWYARADRRGERPRC